MASLFGTISIAVQALQAQQAGLETTTNNLANLSTPGYSREVPILQEADPVVQSGIAFGSGVELQGIESLRDRLLELQINDETQQQSGSSALVSVMNEVQALFPADTSGIGEQISQFFASLNNLSTDPSDLSLRSNVLSAAQNMAQSFSSTATQLKLIRSNLDLNVSQLADQVNQITSQIAQLNGKLAAVNSTGQNYGSFLDQRSNLVTQLSQLIDVSAVEGDDGSLTLTTRQGAPLVVDSQSFDLTTAADSSGVQHVYSQGKDITGAISSGQLGGLLQVRDQILPSLQSQLDDLANGLAHGLNAAQAEGYDLNGDAGQNLFETDASGNVSAASMTVAITDPKKLAASSEPAMSTATSGIVDGSTILASSTIIVNYGPNPSSPSSTDTITIPATDTTLSQVVDDINGDSSLGVTASTSTDSDGATHLVLTSKTSGTAGTINVTWSSVAFGSPTMTIVTGGNTNLTNLANVADTAVSGSLTPTEAYGAMVFQVGNTISDANAEVSASTSILQQLQQQQQSVSGVSLDEEASNLMLYQRAYEAAARAISTVDEMLQLAINMGAQR